MLNNMQMEKVNEIIDYYSRDDNFMYIHTYEYEQYKWHAMWILHNDSKSITSAKDNDFFPALKEALTVASNLLWHTNRDTLFQLITIYENEMREIIYHMEQEENGSLENRLFDFIDSTDELVKLDSSRKWTKLSASEAMTCLAFLKPDKYYFYRPFVMDESYEFIKGEKYHFVSAVKKACDFHALCEDVLMYINEEKKDFVEQYKKILEKDDNCYKDENCHMLVQNLLYILHYSNLQNPVSDSHNTSNKWGCHECKNMLSVRKPHTYSRKSSKGWKYDLDIAYEINKKQKNNGDIGENMIFDALCRQNKSELNHVSKCDDSQHYDISYVDEEGNKIYVEVKTISYNQNRIPRIYISQAEVEFSREKQENYHLYVVLLNKSKTGGTYQIFEGDVTQNTKESLGLEYSRNGDRYILYFDKITLSKN